MRDRVRPRALLFALALLVAADVALRWLPAVPLPRDFRMPDRTTIAYDDLVDGAARYPGARVAVLGDSIVWGAFALPDQTLPAQLSDVFAGWSLDARAYNFGLNGAHAADLLPIAARLTERKAADVIVIVFDPRFYSERATVKRRYPELWARVEDPSRLGAGIARMSAGETSRPTRATLESRLSAGAGSAWRLYDEREAIAAAVLGDMPRGALETVRARAYAALRRRPLFERRAVARYDASEVRAAYAVPPLLESNPHMRQLAALLDLARESGVPVIVVATPVDERLLTRNDWWDAAAYRANLDRVAAMVRAHGGRFEDMTGALPSSALADTHHPLPEGYRLMAMDLAARIAPAVDHALGRRWAGGGEGR